MQYKVSLDLLQAYYRLLDLLIDTHRLLAQPLLIFASLLDIRKYVLRLISCHQRDSSFIQTVRFIRIIVKLKFKMEDFFLYFCNAVFYLKCINTYLNYITCYYKNLNEFFIIFNDFQTFCELEKQTFATVYELILSKQLNLPEQSQSCYFQHTLW